MAESNQLALWGKSWLNSVGFNLQMSAIKWTTDFCGSFHGSIIVKAASSQPLTQLNLTQLKEQHAASSLETLP